MAEAVGTAYVEDAAVASDAVTETVGLASAEMARGER